MPKTLRKHAVDSCAARECLPSPRKALDLSCHRRFSSAFVATSQGRNSLAELAADDTCINCRNKQEVDEAHQKVACMSHTEFTNLINKILLVPGKPYTCLYKTLTNPQVSQQWSCI